jgi:hypothetical protein
MKTIPLIMGFALIALSATACQGQVSPEAADSTPLAQSVNVDTLDSNTVVLSIDVGDGTDYTLADLATFPPIVVTIEEPFIQETVQFTGVAMADLFDDAGVSPDVTVDTVALNDYVYTDSVENFVANRAILAYLADGEPIPVEEGGPVRIVFADDSPYFSVLEAWNWSLRAIILVRP